MEPTRIKLRARDSTNCKSGQFAVGERAARGGFGHGCEVLRAEFERGDMTVVGMDQEGGSAGDEFESGHGSADRCRNSAQMKTALAPLEQVDAVLSGPGDSAEFRIPFIELDRLSREIPGCSLGGLGTHNIPTSVPPPMGTRITRSAWDTMP